MYTIKTSILINAPSHFIWSVLTDTVNYDRWNPMIQEVEGELHLDASIKIRLCVDEESIYERLVVNLKRQNSFVNSVFDNEINSISNTSSYNANVISCIENKALEWEQSSFWLGTYRHKFFLNKQESKVTLFENEIQMEGKLIELGWDKFIKHYYQAGLEIMNEALKIKVELDEDFYIIE